MFSQSNILRYERHIDAGLAKLRLQLDFHAQSGALLNLRTRKLFVFDVLGALLFNQDFGALDSGDVSKLPRSEEHVRIALSAGLVPWTVRFVKLMPKIPVQMLGGCMMGGNTSLLWRIGVLGSLRKRGVGRKGARGRGIRFRIVC